MQGQKSVVFGGSGFLGRQVVQALARKGSRVIAAVRRPGMAGDLRTMGVVGQVTPLACDITDKNSLYGLLEDADIVVNLVGILFEKGAQTFEKVHHEGAQNIAAVAQDCGVKRLLHISALGPYAGSTAAYAQTKLRGEADVLKLYPEATLLRPSLLYGPKEKFFSLYALLLRISPFIPLFGGGKTKFQPVFVGDVARAVLACLETPESKGCLYELAGPDVYTLKELILKVADLTQRTPFFVDLPFSVARLMAKILELFPTPLLTKDQVEMLKSDSVRTKGQKTKGFEDLGLFPVPLDLKLPGLLGSKL